MSTLEDLEGLEREQTAGEKDTHMKDVEAETVHDIIDDEIYNLSTSDINTRRRLLENDSQIMKTEFQRLTHEKNGMMEKIKDNSDKIENNRYYYQIN